MLVACQRDNLMTTEVAKGPREKQVDSSLHLSTTPVAMAEQGPVTRSQMDRAKGG